MCGSVFESYYDKWIYVIVFWMCALDGWCVRICVVVLNQ